MVTRWREAFLFVMASGFAWYLFVAPQDGAASVDTQFKDAIVQGKTAVLNSADALVQKLRDLTVR